MLSWYIWLLVFVHFTSCADYEDMVRLLYPPDDKTVTLPVELGQEETSGCICRANRNRKVIVCFGNYDCKKFPKVKYYSEVLRVRTSVIEHICKGTLDRYYYLTRLDIEANHKLKYIEPRAFRNLTNLTHLSISYNTALHTIDERIFEGLVNLKFLTLVNNEFNNVLKLTPAFKPSILPSLISLDISENSFEEIPEDAFQPMKGAILRTLDINLCRLDYIHPNSFLPLTNLKELNIGENDLNSTLISNLLIKMMENNISLSQLGLSGMGFRKQPPRKLMEVIANTTIKHLILAENQFEIITDNTFPSMPNIEVLDLKKVLAILIGPNAFNPTKFPRLKALLLSGNNLPGCHQKHFSDQIMFLDLSNNIGNPQMPLYYEIDRDTFMQSKQLRGLNLSYNRIKSIFDYTFRGLERLLVLSLENATIFFIGNGTFKSLRQLQYLNIANNPLTANSNLSSSQFEGLNHLKYITLANCGIRRFNDDDNLFEMMPNLTHLSLRNNFLTYVSAEMLKPLKLLQFLDLSENLLIAWWRPLFLASGVKPLQLYLTNNKISHFSISMIQDISYLLEDSANVSREIDFMNNIFVCDCSAMYSTYLWLGANGSEVLKKYFANSNIQCSSPDKWEDKRVADYLSSIKNLNCQFYERVSDIMLLVWTAPSLVTITIIIIIILVLYRYRMYVRYWLFLAKLALGRRFIRPTLKAAKEPQVRYKYDAFVSYCFEDRDFVLEMVAQLEANPPYLKLCISERDFEIGSFISEAILTSINESRFIILVISNNFAKSQWCRWETQLAEYHRLFLEDGTTYDPLVLVRIGEVDNKYLTPTLKYLLKTKIYHLWNKNHTEEFWKKLRNVLTKRK